MSKDTYYFSHDYNARNDRKIAALVRDFKSSGYGIFWATCEMMHEEGGWLEFDEITIGAIAKDMNEIPTLVSSILHSCVDKYKLFMKQNEAENSASMLQSGRVIRNLDSKYEKKQIKSESGRLGGIKSGESRRNNVKPKQNEAERSGASANEANEIKGNEIKGNEIKGNEIKGNEIKGNEDFLWISVVKSFHNDFRWKEKFCRDKSIALKVLESKMIEFISDIELREEFKPLPELKSHFFNWHKKMEKSNGNGRSNGYNKPSHTSVPDNNDVYDHMK